MTVGLEMRIVKAVTNALKERVVVNVKMTEIQEFRIEIVVYGWIKLEMASIAKAESNTLMT